VRTVILFLCFRDTCSSLAFLRSLIASFFNVVLGDKLFGRLLLVSGWKSAAEYVSWTAQREEFIRDFYAKVYRFNFPYVLAMALTKSETGLEST